MARPSLEVRRARSEDLDDLVSLVLASREDSPAGVRAMLAADPEALRTRLAGALHGGDTQFLLARQDGRPVGFLAVRGAPISVLAEAMAMQIDQLYVIEQERRHGVGRALLTAVAGMAERAGAEQVFSNVSPLAKETHRFFARLGFAPLVVRRAVPTSTLRRRLTGETKRSGLEDLLSRRRSLRARSLWPGSGRSGRDSGPPSSRERDDASLADGVACAGGTALEATTAGSPDRPGESSQERAEAAERSTSKGAKGKGRAAGKADRSRDAARSTTGSTEGQAAADAPEPTAAPVAVVPPHTLELPVIKDDAEPAPSA